MVNIFIKLAQMFRYLLYSLLLLFPGYLSAQVVMATTLPQCVGLAKSNFPLIQQQQLLSKATNLTIQNLQKGWLPQVGVTAQATYQSAVIQLPVDIPIVTIEPPSKDQYRLTLDLQQPLYDGGAIKSQKEIQHLNNETEQQKIEAELYKVREKVTQLYLSVLLLSEQLKLTDLLKADLQTKIAKVTAGIENGVVLPSNLATLQAEMLKADQKTLELLWAKKASVQMLALLTNQNLTETTVFEQPDTTIPNYGNVPEFYRPELAVISAQQKQTQAQGLLIKAKNRPKLGLFATAGYGRPGLNQLKNEFDFFLIGGVRANWQLSGLYTRKKEQQLLQINRQSLDVQKDVFLLNSSIQLQQAQTDIEKLLSLLEKDDEIVALRTKIKSTASAQLENGVISASDYVTELNAQNQAEENRSIHRLQLLQAKMNYLLITGQ
ncbi:TolC family protein [Sphingobacteriales bacterium UPWRP_1]|nr:hypothetical protein B6N25_15980 [Sphingobacteriales bacterium TSM_CSS]PSJ74084.1 TolC family protein [Sphingobacteriales bacterium UPWRP_1]